MTTNQQYFTSALARRVESVPASVDRCSAVWRDLVSGELEIVHAVAQQRRSVLILQAPAESGRRLGARSQKILERTLLGNRRKVIASETNVSTSTLAFALKESLAKLGLCCRPSRVPSALVMLAHAGCGTSEPVGTFIGGYEHEGRRLTVVTHVFDGSLLRALPPSERAVLSLVASGRSCANIAARRNCSCRTVVNQVAAACRKLGVSGRLELLHCFATRAAGEPARNMNL